MFVTTRATGNCQNPAETLGPRSKQIWSSDTKFPVSSLLLARNHHKPSIGPAEAQLHSDWSTEPGTRVMPSSSSSSVNPESE